MAMVCISNVLTISCYTAISKFSVWVHFLRVSDSWSLVLGCEHTFKWRVSFSHNQRLITIIDRISPIFKSQTFLVFPLSCFSSILIDQICLFHCSLILCYYYYYTTVFMKKTIHNIHAGPGLNRFYHFKFQCELLYVFGPDHLLDIPFPFLIWCQIVLKWVKTTKVL